MAIYFWYVIWTYGFWLSSVGIPCIDMFCITLIRIQVQKKNTILSITILSTEELFLYSCVGFIL